MTWRHVHHYKTPSHRDGTPTHFSDDEVRGALAACPGDAGGCMGDCPTCAAMNEQLRQHGGVGTRVTYSTDWWVN